MAFNRSGRFSVILAMPGRTGSTITASFNMPPALRRPWLRCVRTSRSAPPRSRKLLGPRGESRASEPHAPITEVVAWPAPFPVVDGADVRVGPQCCEVFEQLGDLPSGVECHREPLGAAHTRHVPRARVVGDRFDVPVR